MKKLPDELDKIEDFYKSNLQNIEVETSESLWNNIESKIPNNLVQPNFLSNLNTLYISTAIVATVVATTLIYKVLSDNNDTRATPNEVKIITTVKAIEPVKESNSNTSLVPKQSQTTDIKSSKKELEPKASLKVNAPLKTDSASIEKTQSVNDSKMSSESPIENTDNQKVAEEKPTNFYEKMSKSKKDTMPLFVPNKKKN
ncbi:MAG: hypothetical protein SFY32_12385 [Bacteroidota bacterium]|nr:hypothetical protein [Bacteroidota bacterium]